MNAGQTVRSGYPARDGKIASVRADRDCLRARILQPRRRPSMARFVPWRFCGLLDRSIDLALRFVHLGALRYCVAKLDNWQEYR